jgi:hypothetical protein
MIYIENDWSDLEEGMQRALRERDALVAHALAVVQPGGGIVGKLEALERERCALQSELAVLTGERARQNEARALARRQALDRTRTTQFLVGLFGVLPAGGVLALGLLGLLFMAPLELIGLYFTDGRDLGRYMGWPALIAGLGGAAFLLGLTLIVFFWMRVREPDDLERDSIQRLKLRLEQVLTELTRVRNDVEADIQFNVQQLLPPGAPDVDVFALWAQRLGGDPLSAQGDPMDVDRLLRKLDPTLPRGVIALRNVSFGAGLDVDLILIGNGRVWLLHGNALAGTLRHVNGAWTWNKPGAMSVESKISHTPDRGGQLEGTQRLVVAALNQTFQRNEFRETVYVSSGIVFTHPEARLSGLGAAPINYGDVSWWVGRLVREFGAAGHNRLQSDRLAFRIADAVLDAQAGASQVRRFPSPGIVSSMFEEQWVALEVWAGEMPSPARLSAPT